MKVGIADEQEQSFLYKQYSDITTISPSTALANYLYPGKESLAKHELVPIFPFGFNLSQKEATEKAINERMSIIEGPPGTGKTQTILNIIANAIINNNTVAVVSNNNAATANVLEKLQKYGVDFIAAYLGNLENKGKFLAEQTGTMPDTDSWAMNDIEYSSMKKELENHGKELNTMLSIKNEVAESKQKLALLSVEHEYFTEYFNETNENIEPYRSFNAHNSDTALALWMDYQQIIRKGNTVSLIHKIKYLFRYGIYRFGFFENSPEKIIAYLQKIYYKSRHTELKNHIRVLEKRLESYRFETVMKQYSEMSMKLFKAKLASKFSNYTDRQIYTKQSLWKEFASFVVEYPVILSTTHSLRSSTSGNYIFDYVIMDEASQVDVVSGALALSCAKKAVIVGDLKQLPNVVTQTVAEDTNKIFDTFNVDTAYRYSDNSMLSSVAKIFENVPRTLLKEHYRCHPKIIGFCNQKFYNNELVILTEESETDKPLMVYKTVKGNHARGNYNQRQIDVIMQEVIPNQIGASRKSIGIISPYRMQVNKLNEYIDEQNIEIDTVHKYQGREKDIIIISTVANEMNEFVDNANLINVAISRAVDKLILVVSDNEKSDNGNIGDLVKYIKYNNYEIINSDIYSVFDLLYQCYSEQLLKMMKTRKNVSLYQSEILIDAVIEKVVSQEEFQNLGYVMHLPLRMLIRDLKMLDDKESRFVMNALTHTDFVIFNKLDKMPVLVVEVDGYAYHENNPQQLKRDQMKDAILGKYGIPIIRLKTNESQEEIRIREALLQVVNGDKNTGKFFKMELES